VSLQRGCNEKKHLKSHGYGYFQADYPNRKTITMRGGEEIQALEKEISGEKIEVEDHTLVT